MNLKTPAFRFREDGKHFENGVFRKRWRHDSHVISVTVAFSNSSREQLADEKHLMCFQSKTFIFKYLLCSVDGSLETKLTDSP